MVRCEARSSFPGQLKSLSLFDFERLRVKQCFSVAKSCAITNT